MTWQSRVQKGLVASLSRVPTPRPSNASEPTLGSVASLAGQYTAPGYGSDLNLCAFIPGQQPTEACQKMIAGKAIVDPKVPTLIAEINAILATHISLRHFAGNIFNVSTINVLVSPSVYVIPRALADHFSLLYSQPETLTSHTGLPRPPAERWWLNSLKMNRGQ